MDRMKRLMGRRGFGLVGMALLAAFELSATGCGAFFVCQGKASCPATTTGTSSTDYAFVSNSATGSTYINGYVVSSGTLVSATSSPTSVVYAPGPMAVTPSNTFLYVASNVVLSPGAIYGYTIGTGGALTQIGTVALISGNAQSMDISPDGKWLIAFDPSTGIVTPYSINSTTGALSVGIGAQSSTQNKLNSLVVAKGLKISPNGQYVVAALGTGGAEFFSFNTSSGAITPVAGFNPNGAAAGINAVAIDSNNYAYLAGTFGASSSSGVQVVNLGNISSPLSVGTYVPTGNGPNAIVLSTNNSFVYVANSTDSTISAFSTSSGVLTQLNSSTNYLAPVAVSALGRDSSGTYLVALGYNATSGTQMYSISSTGTLTPTSSTGSGATSGTGAPMAAIAMSH